MRYIMRFFKRTNISDEPDTRFNAHIRRLQRRTADYLNSRTQHFTATQMKIMLVCFCLITGGLCCYISLKSIIYGNGPPVSTHKKYSVERKPAEDIQKNSSGVLKQKK